MQPDGRIVTPAGAGISKESGLETFRAAGFVQRVRMRGGGHTVELNMEPSEGAALFAEARYGPAAEQAPAFVDRLLSAIGAP